jgi:hypothetical protein
MKDLLKSVGNVFKRAWDNPELTGTRGSDDDGNLTFTCKLDKANQFKDGVVSNRACTIAVCVTAVVCATVGAIIGSVSSK